MGKLIAGLMRAQVSKDVSLAKYSKGDKKQAQRLLDLVTEFLATENPDDSPERIIDKGFTLLIQAKGGCVGFLNYKKFKNDYYHICAFGVDSKVRGQGIGQAALEQFISSVLSEKPKARIMLGVNPENTAARALYLKVGFEVTDTGTEGGIPFELMCYRNQN